MPEHINGTLWNYTFGGKVPELYATLKRVWWYATAMVLSMGRGIFDPPQLRNLGSDRSETQILERSPGDHPTCQIWLRWVEGVGEANAKFVTSFFSFLWPPPS